MNASAAVPGGMMNTSTPTLAYASAAMAHPTAKMQMLLRSVMHRARAAERASGES
jgi:hypothetical protein